MHTQLSLLENSPSNTVSGLVTLRHINHDVSGRRGLQSISHIPGLWVIENFLTSEEQTHCVQSVDSATHQWRSDLSRRVQHYGWRYDYKVRTITSDMKIGALPNWLSQLALRLYEETRLFHRVPEQVIVNEYLPGQGISMHTDHPGFGPTVSTISLLDDWEMDFSRNWKLKSPALLQRGSCVLLTGEARSVWQHGIALRKSEMLACGRRERGRRLSLTFRTVVDRSGTHL